MKVVEKDIISFQEIIRDNSVYDFTGYSLTSLRRRLTRILLEYEMDLETLTGRMKTDPEFLEETVKRLTVHTTELFRDPEVWKKLRNSLLPSWKNKAEINIWHSGCSTGQEVFSMMIVLHELGMLEKTNIYGSDLNEDVIEVAKKGLYKYSFNQSYLENFNKVMLNGKGDYSPKQKQEQEWLKYFTIDKTRDVFQMNQSLCSKPVYKKLDLAQDPNLFLAKFDLIVCRNVIIYFN